jgi:hypothetical protein
MSRGPAGELFFCERCKASVRLEARRTERFRALLLFAVFNLSRKGSGLWIVEMIFQFLLVLRRCFVDVVFAFFQCLVVRTDTLFGLVYATRSYLVCKPNRTAIPWAVS